MDWVQVIEDFGVPVALTVFFVWQGKLREDRMMTRLASLEDYLLGRFEKVVTDNTACMMRVETLLAKRSLKSDPEINQQG